MKIKPLIVLLFGVTLSCKPSPDVFKAGIDPDSMDNLAIHQSGNVLSHPQQDTLTIINSKLTTDPFDLGDNPLKRLSSITNAKVDFRTYKNRHVENQIDTVFQIKVQADRFEVYKAATENWLSEAQVVTDRFQIIPGIKTGMTKAGVKEKLKLSSSGDIPDFVRIQSFEVPQWIDLKFKNDRLEFIEFKGYID